MDSTFFGQSTGLYFYSAVFQGNMALLGLFAVFFVFGSQGLRARLKDLEEIILRIALEIRELRGLNTWQAPKTFGEVQEKLFELRRQKGDLARGSIEYATLNDFETRIGKRIDERESIVHWLSSVRYDAWKPFLFTMMSALISLILLPLAFALHHSQIEIPFFVGTIAINILALFFNGWFVIRFLAPFRSSNPL